MTDQTACINMIKQQLRTNDVLDEAILSLFETVPRQEFVPPAFKDFAYSDMQIPLALQQRMMTPLEEAQILQALKLTGQETVLEIGTGSGFLTAMLSKLAKKVISIEYYAELSKAAAAKLAAHGCVNVELIIADASQGWLEQAPYERVVFTSALETLNETQRLQVLPGGKLVAILGKEPAMQGRVLSLDHQGNWQEKILFETTLPPLIDKLKPKEFVF